MNKPADSPAFPQHFIYEPDKGACGLYTSSFDVGFGGMTLRQFAAIHAMQAILTADQEHKIASHIVAAWSADAADALLAELAKTTSQSC